MSRFGPWIHSRSRPLDHKLNFVAHNLALRLFPQNVCFARSDVMTSPANSGAPVGMSLASILQAPPVDPAHMRKSGVAQTSSDGDCGLSDVSSQFVLPARYKRLQ